MLSKLERNEIFLSIQSAGLEPHRFRWSDDSASERLEHAPTGGFFTFGKSFAGRGGNSYVAGRDRLEPYEVRNWEAVMRLLGEWLERVKADSTTPDLWGQLEAQRQLLAALPGPDAGNT